MAQWFDQSNNDSERSYRQLIAAHMKRCPVCESLVCKESNECHTCTWRGVFEADPFSLEESFNQFLREIPEFCDYAMSSQTKKITLIQTVAFHLGKFFGRFRFRRIDTRI